MRAVLAEAWRSALEQPLRSLLIVLSIAAGAAAAHVLLALSAVVPLVARDVLYRFGSDMRLMWPETSSRPDGSPGKKPVRLRYVDVPALHAAAPSVGALSAGCFPELGAATLSGERAWPYSVLYGVDMSMNDVLGLRTLSGRWFTDEEAAAGEKLVSVNEPLARALFDDRSPLGETLQYGRLRLRIIGVHDSPRLFRFHLLAPYSVVRPTARNGGENVGFVAYRPADATRAQASADELRSAAARLCRFDPSDTAALRFTSDDVFAAGVQRLSRGLELMTLSITLVVLALGSVGAANVVALSVGERAATLGLKKALGATPSRLLAEICAEICALGLTGSLCGWLAGVLLLQWGGALQLLSEAVYTPYAPPALQLLVLSAPALGAVLAALPMARRTAQLAPAAALSPARGG